MVLTSKWLKVSGSSIIREVPAAWSAEDDATGGDLIKTYE